MLRSARFRFPLPGTLAADGNRLDTEKAHLDRQLGERHLRGPSPRPDASCRRRDRSPRSRPPADLLATSCRGNQCIAEHWIANTKGRGAHNILSIFPPASAFRAPRRHAERASATTVATAQSLSSTGRGTFRLERCYITGPGSCASRTGRSPPPKQPLPAGGGLVSGLRRIIGYGSCGPAVWRALAWKGPGAFLAVPGPDRRFSPLNRVRSTVSPGQPAESRRNDCPRPRFRTGETNLSCRDFAGRTAGGEARRVASEFPRRASAARAHLGGKQFLPRCSLRERCWSDRL